MPSSRPLVVALAALLVLTAASWALARVALGGAGVPVALAIAALKAAIVAGVFMEVHRASATVRITGLVTIGLIALLAAGSAGDVLTR